MKKINYIELQQLISNFNNKNLLIEQKGFIKSQIDIKQSKILILKDELIVKDANKEKIKINIDWMANFYRSESMNIIKLEFDTDEEILIHII